MTITLRPYQQKVIDDLADALRKGYRHPLLVLPTGAGKTVIASKLAEGIPFVETSANDLLRLSFKLFISKV